MGVGWERRADSVFSEGFLVLRQLSSRLSSRGELFGVSASLIMRAAPS